MPGMEVYGDEERKEVMDVLETGALFRYGHEHLREGMWKTAEFEAEVKKYKRWYKKFKVRRNSEHTTTINEIPVIKHIADVRFAKKENILVFPTGIISVSPARIMLPRMLLTCRSSPTSVSNRLAIRMRLSPNEAA